MCGKNYRIYSCIHIKGFVKEEEEGLGTRRSKEGEGGAGKDMKSQEGRLDERKENVASKVEVRVLVRVRS